ncbi:hypothetical protein [Pilimelia columellifera]|uniref:Uncharacterized protein n=1 Tax=Pilimelia columellifera subsp. columellifera TaxID=706583 RepID=A0ABP6AM04_9ACTN
MNKVLGPTLITAALAASGVAAAPATAASTNAAATCPARVVIPHVRITHKQTRVYATLTDDCGARYASWNIHNSAGRHDTIVFDPAAPNTRDFLDFGSTHRLGRHDVRPANAHDPGDKRVKQATAQFLVKLGSGTTIKAIRDGNAVTVNGRVRQYDPSPGRWVAWRNARVAVEGRHGAAAPWVALAGRVRADRAGRVTARVTAPRVRQFRLVTQATSTVWGSTSSYAHP